MKPVLLCLAAIAFFIAMRIPNIEPAQFALAIAMICWVREKPKLIVIGLLFVSLSAACAKSGGGSSSATSAPYAKGIFSFWGSTSGLAPSPDLRGGSFGVPGLFLWSYRDAYCRSLITITGSESSATYSVANSVYTTGGSGDPGCASYDQTGTIVRTSDTSITLCRTGGTCAWYD